MSQGIIYKVTCIESGKIYIGQTKNELSFRKNVHVKDCERNDRKYNNIIFYNAIRKYGIENFRWEVLCKCDLDELNEKEIYYIKQLNSLKPNGYNMTLGGEGLKGYSPSKETRKKISKSNKGYKKFQGKTHSEETKRKMSEAQKGRKFSKEHRKKLSESGKVKVFSKEHRKKLSESIGKKYMIITPYGDEILINGLAKFCREYKNEKLNSCNLNLVANGKREHHKNFRCIKLA